MTIPDMTIPSPFSIPPPTHKTIHPKLAKLICRNTDQNLHLHSSSIHSQYLISIYDGLLAQWLRRSASNRKIAGSIPAWVRIIGFNVRRWVRFSFCWFGLLACVLGIACCWFWMSGRAANVKTVSDGWGIVLCVILLVFRCCHLSACGVNVGTVASASCSACTGHARSSRVFHASLWVCRGVASAVASVTYIIRSPAEHRTC